MNTTVVGRNIELTEAMKAYARKVIDEVEKYNLGILHSVITIEKDKRDFFNIEIIMNIPEKGTAVVHSRDKDMYAALDLAKDKLEKLLRRYHDRITDHYVNKDRLEELLVEEEEDEVVEMPLDIEKPLSIEEAVEEYKKSSLYFMVFKDTNGGKRVIYRRKDGKLGLY